MQKEKLIAIIKHIETLSQEDTIVYRTKVSMSSAPREAKEYLYRACDAQISRLDRTNAMTQNGDLDDTE